MAISKDERRFLEEEFLKCYNDIAYMSKHYCDIQTIKYGKIKLDLYPFQTTTLSVLSKNDKAIILKSRQLGISTILSLLAVHRMIFREGYKVTIFANKQKTAVEIIDKIKLIYDGLPVWLKGKEDLKVNNKLEIRLPNGSVAKAFSSSSDEGRSISSSLIIVDEACFVDNLEQLFGSIMPCISTGGEIVLLSTPNSSAKFFHSLWLDAVDGKNGFVPIKLTWDLLPTRNRAWRDQQDKDLGVKLARQEYDAVFAQIGESFFDDETVNYVEQHCVEKPLYCSGEMYEEWYWSTPDYTRKYMTVVDTATGSGGDDSTITIIDLESFEQVYEYQGQLEPNLLAIKARLKSIEFNNAIVVIESTGIGMATCSEMDALGYENIYKTNKSSDLHNMNQFINTYAFDDNLKTGFNMSTKTRPLVLAKLQECLLNKSLKIKSTRALSEMKTFVWYNSKAQSARGSHDDLIMPLAIACYLRETALMFASKSVAMSKQLVSNISVYLNKEYNNFAQIGHNENIIRQYDLQDYDIWN